MRWIVCLLTLLFSGCHGVALFEQPMEESPPPIMPLWERYQQCLAATEFTELTQIIDQFERVPPLEAEPPSWMRAWGNHVMNQPLRMAVDPRALGVACTLRAAAVMAGANHATEAQALYQRVLARYSSHEWDYYVDQAKAALAGLQDSPLAVAALRSHPALLH